MDNGLTNRDRDTIWGILEKYPKIETVHIFGSRAKGVFKTGSDIDLAILNEGLGFIELMRLKSDFEDSTLPYHVDVVYYPEVNNPDLKAHIDRVGKTFYVKVGSERQMILP